MTKTTTTTLLKTSLKMPLMKIKDKTTKTKTEKMKKMKKMKKMMKKKRKKRKKKKKLRSGAAGDSGTLSALGSARLARRLLLVRRTLSLRSCFVSGIDFGLGLDSGMCLWLDW